MLARQQKSAQGKKGKRQKDVIVKESADKTSSHEEAGGLDLQKKRSRGGKTGK